MFISYSSTMFLLKTRWNYDISVKFGIFNFSVGIFKLEFHKTYNLLKKLLQISNFLEFKKINSESKILFSTELIIIT